MQRVLMNREEAAVAGLKRYTPGTVCAAGHACERYVSSGRCVECVAANRVKYRAENVDRVRKNRQEYDARRRTVHAEQARKWRDRNPEKVAATLRRWREKNTAQRAAYEWSRRTQSNASNNSRKRERRISDPVYAIELAVRSRLGRAFRLAGYRKSGRTAQIVGCTWQELKRHIERQFVNGMTWANRATAWHIDHIQPLAGATSAEDLIALCHFTNLRPLWAPANKAKHSNRTHLL